VVRFPPSNNSGNKFRSTEWRAVRVLFVPRASAARPPNR
jgi:hypothetical protein